MRFEGPQHPHWHSQAADTHATLTRSTLKIRAPLRTWRKLLYFLSAANRTTLAIFLLFFCFGWARSSAEWMHAEHRHGYLEGICLFLGRCCRDGRHGGADILCKSAEFELTDHEARPWALREGYWSIVQEGASRAATYTHPRTSLESERYD